MFEVVTSKLFLMHFYFEHCVFFHLSHVDVRKTQVLMILSILITRFNLIWLIADESRFLLV